MMALAFTTKKAAKEPSEREVLADLDDDVVFLHRTIKAMTPERVAELARRFPLPYKPPA